MGALVPTITQGLGVASSLAGTIGTVNNLADSFGLSGSSSGDLEAEQALALQQLKARQDIDAQQRAAEIALEREQIALQAEEDGAARISALRRAVARQRARSGASGIGAGDGSSQAVLLGLFEETEAELAERERLDGLRNNALDLDLSSQQSLNILQRSQLKERQDFERELTGHRFLSF